MAIRAHGEVVTLTWRRIRQDVERDQFRAPVGIDSSTHRGVLYRMGSDLSRMSQGELCHDRCMDLLLAECMQDIGAARLYAKTRVCRPWT